jgi:hypothetical protein
MTIVSHMARVTWRMANYLTGPHVYPVSQLFRDNYDVVEPTCVRRNNKGNLRVFGNKTLWKFSKQDHMERQILHNSVQYLQSRQRSTANTECVWGGGVLDTVHNLVENSETPKAWHAFRVDIGGNICQDRFQLWLVRCVRRWIPLSKLSSLW